MKSKKAKKLTRKQVVEMLNAAHNDVRSIASGVKDGFPIPKWTKKTNSWVDIADCIKSGIDYLERTKR